MLSVNVPTADKEELEKRKTGPKLQRRILRGFNYKGNKREAGNGERRSGMEEDTI